MSQSCWQRGSGSTEPLSPIFDEEEYPLPTTEELIRAGWPKRKDTLARAILAVSLKGGARDFADNETVSQEQLSRREYHHLFPDSLLVGDGRLSSAESYRALNCALITWNTNRKIAAKEPLAYLQERTAGATLGEDEIRSRLASHLVPYDRLAVGGYGDLADEAERASKISDDYQTFLTRRAAMTKEAIVKLCRGDVWS